MLTFPEQHASTAANPILAANLEALAHSAPRTAHLLASTDARADIEFHETEESVLSATLAGRALASRRRPLAEADTLAAEHDPREAAVFVILGFGLGHHVAALARRLGKTGVLIVFEPDLPLLRAVFERIDCSEWLSSINIMFFHDADDSAALSAALDGAEGVLALGARIMEHPPSRARLGGAASRFAESFTRLLAAARTVVVTTMVQTETTLRNSLMNLDHYLRTAEGGGVSELKDLMKGRPAIVVAAGPSLQRNAHLLRQPGVRERVAIIAVQTALKPLLAMGVRPHFVTALDHHEISRRFYESLDPKRVADVTLVAEPKANPAILDGYPGPIRCIEDENLGHILGEDLAGDHGKLPAGATVAHLAYYLARHLGCDPVCLIGQDLAFTDGQYYASGAAIHNVWACELNEFNTLEMQEWRRIVRGKRTLRKAEDVLGRPVYTDEQMHTYLAQFERDFYSGAEKGLTTIDATEGGVKKSNTRIMSLAEALGEWAPEGAPSLPDIALPPSADDDARVQAARARLASLKRDADKISRRSRTTVNYLRQVRDHQRDQRRVNELIAKINTIRDEVTQLQPAFRLVQRLNQTGAFNRARADRALTLDEGLGAVERQRRQVERDMQNVSWIADAADALSTLLSDARDALAGAPKPTRDVATPQQQAIDDPDRPPARAPRVAAVIPAIFQSAPPPPDTPFAGTTLLSATLQRLARSKRLDNAIVLTDDPGRAQAALFDIPRSFRVQIRTIDPEPMLRRAAAVRAARRWAPDCWRGGLGDLTVYDEIVAAPESAAALEEQGFDAGVCLAPEWALVDPDLVDALIERHRERPSAHRIVFTQARPGLAPILLDRGLLQEIGEASERAGAFGSLAGILGYLPVNPQPDPIAKSVCIQIDPALRDRRGRWTLDDPCLRARVESFASGADAFRKAALSEALARGADDRFPSAPSEVTIELTTGRSTDSLIRRLGGAAPERAPMSVEVATNLIESIAAANPEAVIDFGGAGDPLLWEGLPALVRQAKALGLATHVRTELQCEDAALEALVEAAPGVISVDVHANSASIYERLTGRRDYDRLLRRLDALLRNQRTSAGLPVTWIVPRLTRCDMVYEEVEAFFDKWTMLAGHAVLDPPPVAREGERIQPLAWPAGYAERERRRRMIVLSTGEVVRTPADIYHRDAASIGRFPDRSLTDLWRALGA